LPFTPSVVGHAAAPGRERPGPLPDDCTGRINSGASVRPCLAEGIVIAVLSDPWKGGHSASSVSKKIGDAMLADLP
jgi:hypothetical protein